MQLKYGGNKIKRLALLLAGCGGCLVSAAASAAPAVHGYVMNVRWCLQSVLWIRKSIRSANAWKAIR